MTRDEMFEIFKNNDFKDWEGDNALKGLIIISKYTPRAIQCAEHDIIYSESINEFIEKGITEEDCIQLRKLNWHIDNDCLAHYV